MKLKSLKSFVKRKDELGKTKSNLKLYFAAIVIFLVIVWYKTTEIQYQQTEMDEEQEPFYTIKESETVRGSLKGLPQGIIRSNTDLELRPLWSTSARSSKINVYSNRSLLAMSVGIKQKRNVDAIVQKFLPENFTVILFHYDGNLNEWSDLEWSDKAVHIVVHNQTKWWFAKRFLHPDIVSIYDYIFLWDEDLGVNNFDPGRYLKIMRTEGLEISQPALDRHSPEIHHRFTARSKTKAVHRRIIDGRVVNGTKCTNDSEGPPCSGFVEGMAPVFTRSAWYCAWHLLQNDLIHGWGMDMKLGYCAQGDRSEKVGVIDSEYVFHQRIQSLGERAQPGEKGRAGHLDSRTEIRRQSKWELQVFKERWDQAVKEDQEWTDPFERRQTKRHRRDNRPHRHH